ncbi:membrane protein insertase YidC [Streptomyces sp. Rer75]|uniref:YidC/Oxa1 family membrane protein insertase n=1 Tax=unclassified Streptomyces TaxID=2593676 RepID=UPI0015D08175|nr:membrane protein insertase YidC [Streptomyces sp. Rer75]QLH22074.1 YidC/Oxa1 family membrane protein insertase [Streptomyces sp. Rer75]
MSVFASLGTLLTTLADRLDPLFGASATAAAIVLFTLCVRAALHPLARAAARGEKARAALAPRIAELSRKHKNDPERLRRAMTDLQAKEGASPLAGCLPTLVQLPVFFVMYHVFSTGSGAGDLLDHTLAGAPLDGRWGGAFAGQQGMVYLGLFALIAAVATWTYVRTRKAARNAVAAPGATGATGAKGAKGAKGAPAAPGAAGVARVLPLLSFGTLITAAVVPLAAALYLATSTTWTAVERALLLRGR